MKYLLNVNMYSGQCHNDPKVEISENDTLIINDKLKIILNNKTISKTNHYSLGEDRFTLSYPVEHYEDLDINIIYINPNGVSVTYWINEIYHTDTFEDTENLHSFLSDLAKPAIDDHKNKAIKLMEDWNLCE